MQIDIKGTNMDLTEAIKEYVNEKVGGVERLFDQAIIARVDVGKTTNHHQKGDIFRAEINLDVPRQLLRAEAVRDDLYTAINAAKEDLERQIKKYKDKLRGDF